MHALFFQVVWVIPVLLGRQHYVGSGCMTQPTNQVFDDRRDGARRGSVRPSFKPGPGTAFTSRGLRGRPSRVIALIRAIGFPVARSTNTKRAPLGFGLCASPQCVIARRTG